MRHRPFCMRVYADICRLYADYIRICDQHCLRAFVEIIQIIATQYTEGNKCVTSYLVFIRISSCHTTSLAPKDTSVCHTISVMILLPRVANVCRRTAVTSLLPRVTSVCRTTSVEAMGRLSPTVQVLLISGKK